MTREPWVLVLKTSFFTWPETRHVDMSEFTFSARDKKIAESHSGRRYSHAARYLRALLSANTPGISRGGQRDAWSVKET